MILSHQNLHFLAQGRDLLDHLDDDLYTRGDSHGHSSVGAHLRHVLDAYRCLLHGLADRRIDYDARRRDPRVETERAAARHLLDEIVVELERMEEADRHIEVHVRSDAVAWGEVDAWTRSTIGRELQFLLSHTVHHFALIAMTLRGIGFEPARDFGVAPSTLEHQQRLGVPVAG
ncbi:MAG: DinB family protein [Acidobacteriota bacterium]